MPNNHVSDAARAPRYKIFQPIEMRVAGGGFRAHLLDLSSTGALAHADVPPAVGTRVGVTAGLGLGTARVMWASGKRFGIAFTVPLTAGQIAQAMDARRALVANATRRLASA